MSTALVHAFTLSGLGEAPFTFVAYTDAGHVKNGTNCHHCGTAIRHLYTIRSADGRVSIVGCDCVSKTGDKGLIDAGKLAAKKAREAKRQAENVARYAEIERLRGLEEAAQRERNGGRTDAEVSADREERAKAAVRAGNAWLVDVLKQSPGDFCASIAKQLEDGRTRVDDLSPRVRSICADIYARGFGRRGSKPYYAAEAEYWEKVPA